MNTLLRFFLLLSFSIFSLNSLAFTLNISKEYEWGIGSLENLVEVNGFTFGYSSASNTFYLFEKNEGVWTLKEKIKKNMEFFKLPSLLKLSDDTVAMVSTRGEFTTFTISDLGYIEERKQPLGEIKYSGAYKLVNNKLAIVELYPNKIHVFDISENTFIPELLTTWVLPEDQSEEHIYDIDIYMSSVWFAVKETLYQLTSKNSLETLSLDKAFQAPSGEWFGSFEIENDLILIGRRDGYTRSGYFFIDLKKDGLYLDLNHSPIFESNGSEEWIADIQHLNDDVFLLTYPTKLVIADFTDPENPYLKSSYENLFYLFGKSFYKANSLYSPLGAGGFAVFDINDYKFKNDYEKYNKELAAFRALTIMNDNIYLSRMGNAGMLRLQGAQIQQLIASDITELNEDFKVYGESPNCFVEDNEYVYGVRDAVWQININSGAIVEDPLITPNTPVGQINGEACVLIDNTLFLTGFDGHIWYVTLENIQDINSYIKLDLSNEFGNSRGYLNKMTTDGERVFASDSSTLVVLRKNTNEDWHLMESIDFNSILSEQMDNMNIANIIDLDIYKSFLIVSDNNNGHFFSFNIFENTIEFDNLVAAVPEPPTNNIYTIYSSATWRDYLVINSYSGFSIFKQNDLNELVRVQDIPITGYISDITTYKDLLVGLGEGGTLSLFSINEVGDDDGDGVDNDNDAFPLDPNESVDTDNDGIGNNADTDDDGDGVSDDNDAFPLDPNESVDTDKDGIGNNADTDDDGDGVADNLDAYPLDSSRSAIATPNNNNLEAPSSGGSVSIVWLLQLFAIRMFLKLRTVQNK